MNLDNLNTGASDPSASASATAPEPEPAPVPARPGKTRPSSGKAANPK
jgi:hypothetical protein